MELDLEHRKLIDEHLAATSLPPRHVIHTVGTLVDPNDIVVSFTEYDATEPTKWRVFVLTSTNIVHTEIQYETDNYDREEESSPWRRTNPPVMTINAAWTRPLRTITGLHLTQVGDLVGTDLGRPWFRTTSHIAFTDHSTLALPNEEHLYRDDVRRGVTDFVKTLRGLIV
ncbi:hypothetical protein A2J03_09820 [Rhodococcus sp. EPR-157]|uniref:hypothetical protein n=1 Tax=Rhodococcus sp. EPR-157 TaxID=1813677 RepID=UPI0007BBC097|nr:hypothetical protein [Rhodococcus sp. EPR-157]KZF00873.1 hypothetical protein A2J03_09820 [Rhodococcus sp. EPR-157]